MLSFFGQWALTKARVPGPIREIEEHLTYGLFLKFVRLTLACLMSCLFQPHRLCLYQLSRSGMGESLDGDDWESILRNVCMYECRSWKALNVP